MKSKNLFFTLALFIAVHMSGQVNGSGKIISKTYDYKNFDKISLMDLTGKVSIEIGKTWSIKTEIDDNLQDLFEFTRNEKEHLLAISFKGNQKSKMYIGQSNVKITITMPEASVIIQDGNSDLTITNLSGRYLRIENLSNGNITASGKVDQVDIRHDGNGDVDAGKLVCAVAEIKSSGNGDVTICAHEALDASGSGNGEIVNTGKASFSKTSSKQGNGKLIKKINQR
ncbi:DUF2807 domain-containing protein [Flavobacterium sp.]|uniref:GIN domain-containing protein n=1 Tax=Flavobacterium sp. TaxID=239 RepID=UPI00262CE9C1|nr:DUF2807 domain-containing protein [Flavobacterium sp.]